MSLYITVLLNLALNQLILTAISLKTLYTSLTCCGLPIPF
jgi:hypothetical protein